MAISKEQFVDEFCELAEDAGIDDDCAIEFTSAVRTSPRSFADVDPWRLHFRFAPETLALPWQHRRGLIMHELGHVLCRELPGGGDERDADQAALECFGEKIIYDCRWPGKGLQCVRRGNPPYSGYDPDYYAKKLPADPTKLAYQRKRDALNLFLDWNRSIVEDVFRGPDYNHGAEGFDNINHRFELRGKRRVDTLAKAVWWSLLTKRPYYLEDIDLNMLNDTDIAQRAEVTFSLPDYQQERLLAEKEFAYWEDKYGGVFPEDDDEVPF